MNSPHGGAAFAAYRLDDPELVEAGDPGGMLRQVASSAAQVRTAVRACEEAGLTALRPAGRPRAIVVAGAGVGALAGEILAALVGVRSPVQVLTVSGDSWWFNVRPSNTEPLLRLNVEAGDPDAMAALRDEVLEVIRGTGSR